MTLPYALRFSLFLIGAACCTLPAQAQGKFSSKIVAEGLKRPAAAAVLPAESTLRILVAEEAGMLKIVNTEGGKSTVVAKVSEDVPGEITQVLDVVVHPNFAKNREAFVSYLLNIEDTTCFFNVVMVGIPEALQPGAPKVGREILRQAIPCGSAVGGGLAFDKDAHLFVGVGVGKEPAGARAAQQLTTFRGKILKLVVDGEQSYATPADNPYVDVGEDAAAVWAVGFRDPRRLSFDPVTGQLAVIDLGSGLADEFNLVKAKGNYGWPMFEGTECQTMRFDCIGQRFTAPAFTASGAQGNFLSGGAVIRAPGHSLTGRYVFAGGKSGQLYGFPLGDSEGKRLKVPLKFPISSIAAGENGEVFLLDAANGSLRRLQ